MYDTSIYIVSYYQYNASSLTETVSDDYNGLLGSASPIIETTCRGQSFLMALFSHQSTGYA